jgi:hypothetical protein
MLTFLTLKNDLYRMIGVTASTGRADMIEAVRIAILNGQQRFMLYGDWGFLEEYLGSVYIPLQAPYTTGTVSVTQDSKTVTGVGTTFTKDMEGSFFQITDQEWYEIQTFVSTTSLTLRIPVQAASASTQTYQIVKRYYYLPLDFLRINAREAKLLEPGTTSEQEMNFKLEASSFLTLVTGKPQFFAVPGDTKGSDYYNTGTATIATAASVSTWTISSGTLPTDIVDREVRINGEDRSYRINARLGATTFTTYAVYVNPANQTNTMAVASAWAITPSDTPLIAFDRAADQRYIFQSPYIKKLSELLLDTDISPISQAGFDRALKAVCRAELAEDARVAMRGDQVQMLRIAREEALAEAWTDEQYANTKEEQDEGFIDPPRQAGPSWMAT